MSFENHVRSLGETDSKLMLYGKVKRQYLYVTYLDSDCYDLRSLVKFRMSIHGFPIERGRYNKPKTPRNGRLCLFCRKCIGDENHVMMECDHDILKNIREYYISQSDKKFCNGQFTVTFIFQILHFMYRYEHSTSCCNMD